MLLRRIDRSLKAEWNLLFLSGEGAALEDGPKCKGGDEKNGPDLSKNKIITGLEDKNLGQNLLSLSLTSLSIK